MPALSSWSLFLMSRPFSLPGVRQFWHIWVGYPSRMKLSASIGVGAQSCWPTRQGCPDPSSSCMDCSVSKAHGTMGKASTPG